MVPICENITIGPCTIKGSSSVLQGTLTLTSVVERGVKICRLSSVIIKYLRICLEIVTKMFWNVVWGMCNLMNKSAYLISVDLEDSKKF